MTAKNILQIQLEEAIQMLRLVANEERTCVEVREWLEQNYPEDTDKDSQNIINLIIKNISK
jgi:hypothetical protein